MSDRITAKRDEGLKAVIVEERPMVYQDGASDDHDRPPHVRAASGLTAFREYLAVVQDDANWLALIDADDDIHAVALPPSPDSGARVFSEGRGNKHEKFDLEACITVPGHNGPELIGFGSGSHVGREWILRIHEHAGPDGALDHHARVERIGFDMKAAFFDARRFYDSLRDNKAFSGAGLNIEGAIVIDDETIRLFERGNAPKKGDHDPVDATGDISWHDLRRHLEDPETVPPPAVENIRRYDLGALDGVALTFSDAEYLGDGRVLYSVSAEDRDTGRIAGSALGLIEADGRARWAEVFQEDGDAFPGKIEGLTRHPRERDLVQFVIDDDDETLPSKIFTARLSGGYIL